MTSVRAAIADALVNILEGGQTLDFALQNTRLRALPVSDAAYAQECLYGVLRRYYQLARRLNATLQTPLKARDLPIKMLLLSGLNELLFMSTPPYAVVDQTVKACAEVGRPWAKGLVNAVLRRVIRKPEEVFPQPTTLEEEFDHPAWLISAIKSDWPAHWTEILRANNAHPPMVLRVNTQKCTRSAYHELLAENGIQAHPTEFSPVGLRLEKGRPVHALPNFDIGHVSVQDEAAQLAIPVLDCQPGHRVLDACAAPGGKVTHLLESAPEIELLAIDISARRVNEIRENFTRLALNCKLLQADACVFAQELSPTAPRYDRILLDAPCSAVGVIRRHPDIKLRRSPADILQAAHRQTQLLCALWPLLIAGGRLLYITCSILNAENDDVVEAFLATNNEDVKIVPIEASWGQPTRFGRQILPGSDAMDGFYYALIEKNTPLA
jgi:16S rRNA (cytosine967-C5)-methyltransferase